MERRGLYWDICGGVGGGGYRHLLVLSKLFETSQSTEEEKAGILPCNK